MYGAWRHLSVNIQTPLREKVGVATGARKRNAEVRYTPQSPEPAPPVEASTSRAQIPAFTGGACSGDYSTRKGSFQYEWQNYRKRPAITISTSPDFYVCVCVHVKVHLSGCVYSLARP